MASAWDNPETEAQTLLGLAMLRAGQGRGRPDAQDLASNRDTELQSLEPAARVPLAVGTLRRRLEPPRAK
jgi:hypothetical protein